MYPEIKYDDGQRGLEPLLSLFLLIFVFSSFLRSQFKEYFEVLLNLLIKKLKLCPCTIKVSLADIDKNVDSG